MRTRTIFTTYSVFPSTAVSARPQPLLLLFLDFKSPWLCNKVPRDATRRCALLAIVITSAPENQLTGAPMEEANASRGAAEEAERQVIECNLAVGEQNFSTCRLVLQGK
eukprot:IDg15150t1